MNTSLYNGGTKPTMFLYNAFTNTTDQPYPNEVDYPLMTVFRNIKPSGLSTYQWNNGKMEQAQAYLNDFNAWAKKHNIPQTVLDQWQAEIILKGVMQGINANAAALQNSFWSKMKDKYQTISNNVSNVWQESAVGQATIAAQNGVKKFVDAVKDKAGFLKLSVLLPFKPMLVMGLRQKGKDVSLNDSLLKLAVMFNDVVILNKSTFDPKHYEHLDQPQEDIAISLAASAGSAGAAAGGVPIPPAILDKLIHAIVNYIKNLQKKKESGDMLTPEENSLLNTAEQGAESIKDDKPKDWSKLLKGGAICLSIWGAGKLFKWW